jgi:hypothetical protein
MRRSVCMLTANRFEVRDRAARFGLDHESYRQDAGMLTPRLQRTPHGSV